MRRKPIKEKALIKELYRSDVRGGRVIFYLTAIVVYKIARSTYFEMGSITEASYQYSHLAGCDYRKILPYVSYIRGKYSVNRSVYPKMMFDVFISLTENWSASDVIKIIKKLKKEEK